MGATPLPANEAAFSLDEVLAATGGVVVQRGAERARCVSTNTRGMAPGALFVALRGAVHDAHDHVAAAAAAGAQIVLVEREVAAPAGLTVVRVSSTMRALADLAELHSRRWHALGGRTMVGITGSAGKTTTRVAVAAVARALFPGEVVPTRGNLNNRIGVPMMIFSLGAAQRVAVLELGTSEPGEIAELARMTRSDVGVLTLIAAAHLEGLGSIEGVAEEKAALYRALAPDGLAVANADDARVVGLLALTPAARRARYGRAAGADACLIGRAPRGMDRAEVTLRCAAGEVTFETPLVGEAGALACAAAVAIAEGAWGARLSGPELTRAFAGIDTSEGAARLVAHTFASGLAVLDDAYNANPASMVASIRAAAEMAQAMGRPLVLVLGQMHELGPEALEGHRAVGQAAAESGARLVVSFGAAEARGLCQGTAATFVGSLDEAVALACARVEPGDLVLVKGSRASGAERVVAALAARHG